MPNAIRATVRRSVAHGHPHLQRMSRAFSDLVGAFRRSTQVDGLTIVTDEASADRALAELRRLGDRVHAWDTETAEVRPGRRGQTPCHTGRVVCATAFCGDDVDFGQGPMLLVDNVGPAAGLIQRKFHSYFEDSQYKKVFHNYAFDKLMLKREGVTVDGLQADTLILARLHDTSLSSWEGKARREAEGSKAEAMAMGYGQGNPQKVLVPTRAVKGVAFAGKTMDLKSLHTTCIPIEDKAKMQKVATIRRGGYDLKSLAWHYGLAGEEAQGFAELFGAAQDVALKQFDSPDLFPKFALYAARDAVYTYKLFHLLRETLHQTPWNSEAQRRDVAELLLDDQVAEELRRSQRKHTFFTMPRQGNAEAEARGAAGTSGSVQLSTGKTMWDFYNEHLSSRFSECLVNMQERGILLDSTSLQRIEHDASADFQRLRQRFQELLREIRDPQGHCLNPDADKMNLNSSMQLRTLLFGGTKNRASDEELEVSRSFPVSKDSIEAGIKHSKRFELNSWRLTPGRNRKFVTAKGWPSTCKDALEALLNDEDNNVRKQLDELGWSPEMVEKAAEAMQVHRQMASVKNVLTAFAEPMQEHASTQGRLHPSWSYGTSTGRLSCSNPNLQALPSPEKDSYKVRSALKAADGHTFILVLMNVAPETQLVGLKRTPEVLTRKSLCPAGNPRCERKRAEMTTRKFPYQCPFGLRCVNKRNDPRRGKIVCQPGFKCGNSEHKNDDSSTKLPQESELDEGTGNCPIGLWCSPKRELGFESSDTLEDCPPGLWCKRNGIQTRPRSFTKRANKEREEYQCPTGLWCSVKREEGYGNSETVSQCPPGLWCKREEAKREHDHNTLQETYISKFEECPTGLWCTSKREVGYENSESLEQCPPGLWCKKNTIVSEDENVELNDIADNCPNGLRCSTKRQEGYENTETLQQCPPGLWCKRRVPKDSDIFVEQRKAIRQDCPTGLWCALKREVEANVMVQKKWS